MQAGRLRDIFLAFLWLGLTSFGGPTAHIGYFRQEFVVRRRWIEETAFADLLSLCHFLPGPASSQLGFAIGLQRRGGLTGGLAAWAGFTLPSALLLFLGALLAGVLDGPRAEALLHGLQLVALAVVAQAVWGMTRALTPDRPRAAIGLASFCLLLLLPSSVTQLGVIAGGALAGLWLCRGLAAPVTGEVYSPLSRGVAGVALLLFLLLFLVPASLPGPFAAFYRAGAFVFGGGHVVLPLLQTRLVTPGLIGEPAFLAGYGLAQAVPGPLFTIAAYLGAATAQAAHQALPAQLVSAACALAAIFLPGMLLLVGVLPFWDGLRRRPVAQAAMRGANAAVLGLLGAALYTPIWTSAVHAPADVAVAALGFLLLTLWQAPPWSIVLLLALLGTLGL
ncbi:chromate efflux transporter [Acidisoma sp. 7E03]